MKAFDGGLQNQTDTVRKSDTEQLAIKGVGILTAAGFLAEVGDIGRFQSPKQIQKLAELELVENSSDKHKDQTAISKRGRRKLRKVLYQVVMLLIWENEDFCEVYDYYRPLHSCILYDILNRVDYNGQKMLQ
ncbi:IS110 family transposase [Lacrimispora sp.]|uniref:IS110 family transposase n=1 Tax=Lacrimispora sp. TaxID=2719234 RepID=UPI0028AA68EB|nr:IS110 family transposase [Lacrimispora sp.]